MQAIVFERPLPVTLLPNTFPLSNLDGLTVTRLVKRGLEICIQIDFEAGANINLIIGSLEHFEMLAKKTAGSE
jgi:hypothetical protein